MELSVTQPAAGSKQRLVLVDGHAYAYRSFHAIRQLSAPDGFPTNAIFGFIKATAKLREVLKPDGMLVVWDGGLAPERVAALPGYKAQRPPMPGDLARQLDGINEYLDAAGIPWFCRDNVEADDWIAAVAVQAVEAGFKIVIASSDKDFMQLVSPDIGLFNPGAEAKGVWTDQEVREKTGVAPGQIVDWLSLIGDSVDNIPGVPGVGPKTAAELLLQFGSVDALWPRLSEVKSARVRSNLENSREQVARNIGLIRLNTGMTCQFGREDACFRKPNRDRLRELYARWGFRSMLAQLEAELEPAGDWFGRNWHETRLK